MPRQRARMVNVDICSGSQSQRKANCRLGGLRTICIDLEREVHCYGSTVVNYELDVAIGAAQLYVAIGRILHSAGIAMSRVAAITVTSDCKTTCTSAASIYRDEAGNPWADTAEGEVASKMDLVVTSCVGYMARMASHRARINDG